MLGLRRLSRSYRFNRRTLRFLVQQTQANVSEGLYSGNGDPTREIDFNFGTGLFGILTTVTVKVSAGAADTLQGALFDLDGVWPNGAAYILVTAPIPANTTSDVNLDYSAFGYALNPSHRYTLEINGPLNGVVQVYGSSAATPYTARCEYYPDGVAVACRTMISPYFIIRTRDEGWLWPIENSQDRKPFAQDYAEFGACTEAGSKHHTGWDIARPAGTTRVRASHFGTVILLQRNDTRTGCVKKVSVCSDHGFGNTIILRHDLPGGAPIFTQYSHMQAFDSQLETRVTTSPRCIMSNAGFTYTCSPDAAGGIDPVKVLPADRLGFVGNTGNGTTPYGAHLHFETKTFATLNTPYDLKNGYGYGYTYLHPDSLGYIDPSLLIEGTSSQNGAPLPQPRAVVQVTSAGMDAQANYLRVGPREDYNCHIADTSTAEVCDHGLASGIFIAMRTAPPTSACGFGWYQVSRPERDIALSFNGASDKNAPGYFANGSLSKDGKLPEAWICAGVIDNNVGTEWTRLFRSGGLDGHSPAGQADLCALNTEVSNAGKTGLVASGPDDARDLNGDMRVNKQDVDLMGRLCSPSCKVSLCSH